MRPELRRMRNRESNRLIVICLVIIMVLPASWCAAAPKSPSGTPLYPRAAPDHNASLTISNLTTCQKDNVVAFNDGIELERSNSYVGQQEFGLSYNSTYSITNQVAAYSNGEYVIVWVESQPNYVILGQRYSKDGNKIGNQLNVNNPGFDVYGISIVVNSRDELILAFWEYGATSSEVYFRRYDKDLNPIGAKTQVSAAAFKKESPSVALGPNDVFAITWAQVNTLSIREIHAQRYAADGTKSGGEILVSSLATMCNSPRIAIDNNSTTVITWYDTDYNMSSNIYNTYAQWYNPSGDPIGGNVKVTPQNSDLRTNPKVVADDQGGFFIAWANATTPSSNVNGQWYDSRGNRSTNGPTEILDAYLPSVAMVAGGLPLIAYVALSSRSVYLQAVDRQGGLSGGRIPVMTLPLVRGSSPELAADSLFNIMMTWSDNRNTTNDLFAMYFQRPYVASGKMVTSDLSPDWLYAWTHFTGSSVLGIGSTLTFDYSTDAGASWQPVPGNGSLAAAGGSPLRIRANLGTSNPAYSPSLKSLVLSYVANHPPVIAPHENSTVWKNSPQTVQALATDTDSDPLTYNWTQQSGPSLVLSGQGTATLGFTPNRSGAYVFRLVVNDGYADSLAAFVNYTVDNKPPVAALAASATTPFVGVAVIFNASGSSGVDDNITAYNFRFGDGSESGWGPNATASHAYASPGSYNASASARDEEGNESASQPVVINVTLNNVPRLTVTSPKEGQTYNGSALAVTFTVENLVVATGSSHIHYQLDGQGEVMWFSPSSFSLTNLTDGKHLLKVYLADANHTRLPNPEAYVQVNFTVQLPPMPDLAVTGSDIKLKPQSPKEGETVTITATIYNVGQVDVGAFTVRFLVDGTALPDQSVVTLGKGSNIVREATWKATAGSHTIKVVIDPANSVNEAGKANNEASVNLSVAKKPAPAAEFPWMLIGVILVLVVVVAVLAAVMLMRRKKPVTVMPYQSPPAYAPVQAPPPYPSSPQAPPQTPMQPQQNPPPPPFSPPQQPPPVPPPS